ncbi:MAG: hypothetical protein ABIH23_00205 [bacterium]
MANQGKSSKKSDLDIGRLRQEFNKIILPSKAKELGVDAKDLVTTFRGGRRVFTTRERAAKDLKKQRKITASAQPETQRAIRGGENSIVGDIESRLADCARLMDALKKSERITLIEEHDTKASLKTAANNALRIALQIQEIEAEIERKKEADPLLSSLDKLILAVKAAKDRGDQETAVRLLNENRENLAQYESRRRVLEPDIQSALHSRYGLLREQRRVMKTQLQLHSQRGRDLQSQGQTICASSAPADLKARIIMSVNALEKELNIAEPLQAQRGAVESATEGSIRDRNKILEEEIHQLRESIGRIDEQAKHLAKLVAQADAKSKVVQRMVYREKQE